MGGTANEQFASHLQLTTSYCMGRGSRRVVNQSSVHFGTAFWNHHIRCGITADSTGLRIVGHTTRPSTHCIWTSQTTPHLSLATKMPSIGLTICRAPFAMRRKSPLEKNMCVCLSHCSFHTTSFNGHMPLPPPVAACRKMCFTCFLRPANALLHYRGWELVPRPCPSPRPFKCLSWCRKHQSPSAWQMLFAISAAFPIPSGSSPGESGVAQVTTSNRCSTTPVALQFLRMSALGRPAHARPYVQSAQCF